MMTPIDLGTIRIPLDQYAAQGNAVLGIRGSGKSYTATYIAERLLDAGVPIVAFDPVGIWRYLRVPGIGAGYRVVVAGGEHGDFPLTAAGAAEIMRAAMRDGVSIIFDLYDINLSKGDWRRVVESALKVLLYENKAHGPRHVFLEEAAEFCPQRLPPGDSGASSVYSMVERLARMGGNAQLGYTLINQRAEEVNKAVLELCDLLILHRQKGRNSLTALGKWLDVGMAKSTVIKEVPALENGEAFVWPAGDEPPIKTRIPKKRTFHPDRRAPKDAAIAEKKTADVSAFVATMRESLAELTKQAQENDPKLLKAELAKLRKSASSGVPTGFTENDLKAEYARGRSDGWNAGHQTGIVDGYRGCVAQAMEAVDTLAFDIKARCKPAAGIVASPAPTAPGPLMDERSVAAKRMLDKAASVPSKAWSKPPEAARIEGVSGPQQRILEAVALLEHNGMIGPSRVQVALWADASPTSSSFVNNLGSLRTAGLIGYPAPGAVTLTKEGRDRAPTPTGMTTEQMHAALFSKVGGPKTNILRALIGSYPKALSREALAEKAGASAGSSSYVNNLGALRTLGVIDYPSPGYVVALEDLFLN